MNLPNMPQETLNDLQSACNIVNQLIVPEDAVTIDRLITFFEKNEDPKTIFQKGKSLNSVKEQFINNTDPITEYNKQINSLQLITEGVSALWQWAAAGFGIVEIDKYKSRLSACNSCDKYIDPPDNNLYKLADKYVKSNKICSMCGCLMEKKAKLTSSKCPVPHPTLNGLNKWEEPITK